MKFRFRRYPLTGLCMAVYEKPGTKMYMSLFRGRPVAWIDLDPPGYLKGYAFVVHEFTLPEYESDVYEVEAVSEPPDSSLCHILGNLPGNIVDVFFVENPDGTFSIEDDSGNSFGSIPFRVVAPPSRIPFEINRYILRPPYRDFDIPGPDWLSLKVVGRAITLEARAIQLEMRGYRTSVYRIKYFPETDEDVLAFLLR